MKAEVIKGQDHCVCQLRVKQYVLGWSSRPDPGEDKRGHLLWAPLAAISSAGWRVEETGSGKGILKKDDWLALAAVSVFIVMAAQLVSLWLWGISPCGVLGRLQPGPRKAANHSRGSLACWAS